MSRPDFEPTHLGISLDHIEKVMSEWTSAPHIEVTACSRPDVILHLVREVRRLRERVRKMEAAVRPVVDAKAPDDVFRALLDLRISLEEKGRG